MKRAGTRSDLVHIRVSGAFGDGLVAVGDGGAFHWANCGGAQRAAGHGFSCPAARDDRSGEAPDVSTCGTGQLLVAAPNVVAPPTIGSVTVLFVESTESCAPGFGRIV
ncbi:hypothetical protein GCM10009780_26290 [Actinomadura alba]